MYKTETHELDVNRVGVGNIPLLPRIKASPYLFFNCPKFSENKNLKKYDESRAKLNPKPANDRTSPLTNSSVFSSAMFM